MLYTDLPAFIPEPFGKNAGGSYIHTIPTASQIGVTDGAASYNDGFPPLCFTARGAGGKGPFGNDVNGILKATSSWDWWLGAGGPVFFDSTHSTAIGGYPKYALLCSTTLGIYWQSQVDNNTVDPDAGPSANWVTVINATGSDPANGESVTLPNGKILKDGAIFTTFSSGSTYTITFATPFPNACRSPVVVAINSSALATMDVWVQIETWDRFGITFVVQDSNTAGTHYIDGVTWDAKGY